MFTDAVSKDVSEKERKERSCNFELITLYLKAKEEQL
jgi:hypothetical protein